MSPTGHPKLKSISDFFHKLHTPLCLIFLLTFTIFAHSFMSLLLGFCLTFRPHCIDDLSILAWRCTWETILKQKYSGKNFPVRKFRTNQDQGRGWAKNTVWAFFLISAIIPNYFFCTFFFGICLLNVVFYKQLLMKRSNHAFMLFWDCPCPLCLICVRPKFQKHKQANNA